MTQPSSGDSKKNQPKRSAKFNPSRRRAPPKGRSSTHGGPQSGPGNAGAPKGAATSNTKQGQQAPDSRKGPRSKRDYQNRGPHNRGFKKGRPKNKRRVQRPLDQELHLKYIDLLQKHHLARKKYFELFHRADPQQLTKLQNQFYKSAELLRKFEESLSPNEKEILKNSLINYENDTAYSENHEITSEENSKVPEGPANFHISLNQQNRESYKDDTEESVGTIEDYKKLKGIL